MLFVINFFLEDFQGSKIFKLIHKVNQFVPIFIDAFEQEHKEKIDAELAALENVGNNLLTPPE